MSSESILPLELEFRMYFLVPYNISPIQQGIQAGHAVVEYGNDYSHTKEYRKWAGVDKTFIILNGGTMNERTGTMNAHLQSLLTHGVTVSTFREPDLNDGLSAIAFLVDERVFDKVKYPTPLSVTVNRDITEESCESGALEVKTLQVGKRVPEDCWTSKEFVELTGSYANAYLRGFLQDFRLA